MKSDLQWVAIVLLCVHLLLPSRVAGKKAAQEGEKSTVLGVSSRPALHLTQGALAVCRAKLPSGIQDPSCSDLRVQPHLLPRPPRIPHSCFTHELSLSSVCTFQTPEPLDDLKRTVFFPCNPGFPAQRHCHWGPGNSRPWGVCCAVWEMFTASRLSHTSVCLSQPSKMSPNAVKCPLVTEITPR